MFGMVKGDEVGMNGVNGLECFGRVGGVSVAIIIICGRCMDDRPSNLVNLLAYSQSTWNTALGYQIL